MSFGSAGSLPLFSLPIETLNRELLAKALLAGKAVDQGWAVLFGAQSCVCRMMQHCPAGVHLEISIPEHKCQSRLTPLSHSGHRLVCLCEEGFIYHDGDVYCSSKVGESSLRLLDAFFATGQRQAGDLRAFRDFTDSRLVVTGNPRFDLLHWPYRALYSDDVGMIGERTGTRFILFNSNLVAANPHPSYGDLMQMFARTGRLSTDRQRSILEKRIALSRRLLSDYQEILSQLAYSGITVVIRPHPSENHEFWSTFAASVGPRLKVIHEGSANAWSLAADLVIHTGCTTGVEAFLMQRPVIAYLPEYLSDDTCISNRLGFQAATTEQLVTMAHSIMGKTSDQANSQSQRVAAEQRALAMHRVANSEEPFACDRILDALARLGVPRHPLSLIQSRLRRCRRPTLRRLLTPHVRKLFLSLPDMALLPSLRRRKSKLLLDRQKFAGLGRDELMSLFARLHALGLIQTVPDLWCVEEDVFLLTPRLDQA